VLGNAASLASRHAHVANDVEQAGHAVLDMTP
jgi:hypothetical protein